MPRISVSPCTFRLSLVLAMLVACSFTAEVAAGPVALVGGGYGEYVRRSMIKKVLVPHDIAYEDFGVTMDWDTLGEYSLVIVAHGDEELTGGREVGPLLDEYIRSGGHLLLIGNGPAALLGTDVRPWAFMGVESWVYNTNAPAAAITDAAHPWPAGLDPATEYYWLTWAQRVARPTTAQVLMGTADAAFMTVNEHGAGWAAFISRGPFPFTRDDVGPQRDAQLAMFARIVMSADPLTVTGQVARELANAPQGALVAWQRDWQQANREGPEFRPPYPEPQERISALDVDIAIGEREDISFNLLAAANPGPVRITVGDLQAEGVPAGPVPEVAVKIMGRAPLIPWDRPNVEPYETPYWLLPPQMLPPEGDTAFVPEEWKNTVVWLEVNVPEGCSPGEYRAQVQVSGHEEQVLPLVVRVWPLRMGGERLFQLRAWGFTAPDVRFWDEYSRQRMNSGYLSYPDLEQVMLPEYGISLEEAIENRPEVFAAETFPELDFSYLDAYIVPQAARGLSVMRYQDIRTGAQVANAATGLDIPHGSIGGEEVTDRWREIWVAYYRQVMQYLHLKGYRRVECLWTDEPSRDTIRDTYVPIAELYIRAGMHPGSHWTTPGFMSPEQVNEFAHAVSDWSMYGIMMPNFHRFIAEGAVTLRDEALIGLTRGGYGFMHRWSPDIIRCYAWDAWRNGATFLRTGPLWKGWIYYLNYDLFIRDEGIGGERLMAYSSADPDDLGAPLLPSPDWNAARDGCDDISLVMVLQWYLEHLAQREAAPAQLLADINAELAGFIGENSPYNMHLTPRQYRHADMEYDYSVLEEASSGDMHQARRRVLEMLVSLAPYVDAAMVSMDWHEIPLAREGRPLGAVRAPAMHAETAKNVAFAVQQRTGLVFPVVEDIVGNDGGIVLCTVNDEAAGALLASRGWSLPVNQPGPGSYVIFTCMQTSTVAVVGGDEAGLAAGAQALTASVSPRGHWLVPPEG